MYVIIMGANKALWYAEMHVQTIRLQSATRPQATHILLISSWFISTVLVCTVLINHDDIIVCVTCGPVALCSGVVCTFLHTIMHC